MEVCSASRAAKHLQVQAGVSSKAFDLVVDWFLPNKHAFLSSMQLLLQSMTASYLVVIKINVLLVPQQLRLRAGNAKEIILQRGHYWSELQ